MSTCKVKPSDQSHRFPEPKFKPKDDQSHKDKEISQLDYCKQCCMGYEQLMLEGIM